MKPAQRDAAFTFATLVVFNLVLLLPGFVFRHDHPAWTPFFPQNHPGGPFDWDLRSVVEWPLAVLIRRTNPDPFRLAAEWWCACAILLALPRSARRLGRGALAAAYVAVLLFLLYEHAFRWFFLREPVISADATLLLNLWHFLFEMRSTAWLPAAGGGLALIIALGVGVARSLQRLESASAPVSRGVWGLAAWSLLSVAWFGVERDDPAVQVVTKRIAWNFARAEQERARWARALKEPPDRRYDDFSRIELTQPPDVSLIVVEAYGTVLATWDLRTGYTALMSRVEARLAARGYFMATLRSAAPVHGGFSWLSLATLQSGVLIDRQEAFRQLLGTRVPTLSGFFKQHGYSTLSVQPGTSEKPGAGPRDWLEHDRFIGAEELEYRGRPWGFGRIPDQVAWARLRQVLPQLRRPRFVTTFNVSTHYPWGEHVPPYLTAESLASGEGEDQLHDARWPPLPGPAPQTAMRASYLRSIDYEFRLITEHLEADPSPHHLVLIVGDHQPRLESNPPPEATTLDTPVHIISTDPALVEHFIALGAAPGLSIPEGPAFSHEGFFSLTVSALAHRYGTPLSRVLGRHAPDGAAPSALYR